MNKTNNSSVSKVNNNYIIDRNELFKEFMIKQLKTIPPDKKLQYSDIKRICKYISSSIFDYSSCCLWNGYITNINNSNKGTYINFYFKKKKVALHRLLYSNFVGELTVNEYLKFNCENKGKCCNIHHLKKFKYQKKVKKQENKLNNNSKYNNNNNNNIIVINKNTLDNTNNKNILMIDFD